MISSGVDAYQDYEKRVKAAESVSRDGFRLEAELKQSNDRLAAACAEIKKLQDEKVELTDHCRRFDTLVKNFESEVSTLRVEKSSLETRLVEEVEEIKKSAEAEAVTRGANAIRYCQARLNKVKEYLKLEKDRNDWRCLMGQANGMLDMAKKFKDEDGIVLPDYRLKFFAEKKAEYREKILSMARVELTDADLNMSAKWSDTVPPPKLKINIGSLVKLQHAFQPVGTSAVPLKDSNVDGDADDSRDSSAPLGIQVNTTDENAEHNDGNKAEEGTDGDAEENAEDKIEENVDVV